MAADHQDFLRRWSRLKRQVPVKPESGEKGEVCVTAPLLPPVDSLKFDSDFAAFMHAKVDQGIRRAALKKLFGDPRFNVMDGLDVYIDDYSKEDPIPPGMLAQLEHARTTLFGPQTENKAGDEKKPPENMETSVGTLTCSASSNDPPRNHCDADLVPNQDPSRSLKP